MDPQVTIAQLGGNKFRAMTGVRGFTFDPSTSELSFRLPNPKVNHVRITLNGNDLYDIKFGRIRKSTYKVVETVEDVYAENLQDVFTRVTGLRTTL